MPLSAEALQALVAGDVGVASELVGVALAPDLASRSHALLNLRLGDLRVNPASGDWLLRAIALRTPDRPMVGLVGFHGPPDITGSVEVGYEIERLHRGRGYATEATATLVRWAFDQNGVRRVAAAIRPDNMGSLGVVRRLGFSPAGSRWDAIDGTALLFERRSAPPLQPPAEEGGKMSDHAGSWSPAGLGPEAPPMTQDDATPRDTDANRDTGETRAVIDRLKSIFGGHPADPADPEHACRCGWKGESYGEHLARETVTEMRSGGYSFWPSRHA